VSHAAATHRTLPPALGRVAEAIRPHPHRGDVLAAGVVPLTLAVLLIEVRFHDRWADGVHVVLCLLAFGLVYGMGLLAPLEGERPRPYHLVLLLCGLVLLAALLLALADAFGAEQAATSSGPLTWMLLLFAAAAAYPAVRFDAPILTLLAALALGGAFLAFIDWAFEPRSLTTFRWMLLLLLLGYTIAHLMLRDTHRPHAVMLADAAGVAALALVVTLGVDVVLAEAISRATFGFFRPSGAGGSTGWELVVLAAGFGLVAYGSIDRERGPAWLGALVLLAFALVAGLPSGDGPSLLGWPLLLLLIGVGGVVLALRPRIELPPEPGEPAEMAPLPTRPGPTGTTPAGAPLWAKEGGDPAEEATRIQPDRDEEDRR
jgi:hypothetical protein